MASHDRGRTVALSRQLAAAHDELRRRIDRLKAGDGPDGPALVTHCLAFCNALTSHHRGEDGGMFAELLRECPEFAPTVSKLVEDHAMIAAILSRVAELAAGAAGTDGVVSPALRGELDGLSAIMESHFNYEERALRRALDDGGRDTGWSGPVLRFRDDTS